MPLWGKTDNAAGAPKFLPAADASSAVFIDTTEAGVTSNRAAGLHTAGWNLYKTYTDAQGNTRRRVESLVPMKVTAASAGDAGVGGTGDDAIAADS